MSLNKPLTQITEDDLNELVGVAESKMIDYKITVPGASDGDRKEFLCDVTAFANASGGHLILGVREEAGVATAICGFDATDANAMVLRLENMLRDGVQPRIAGVQIQPIRLQSDKTVIIVRIPRSWAMPHMVVYQKDYRFYARNSAGKYTLDVGELRNLFTFSATLDDRVRAFRLERLARIGADEAPVLLGGRARAILHVIPLSAFDPSARYDLGLIRANYALLQPLHGATFPPMYNYEGLVTQVREGANATYLQVFRNGIIEWADSSMMNVSATAVQIPSVTFAAEVRELLGRCLNILRALQADFPVVVALSLIGVKGCALKVREALFGDHSSVIDRDALVISEVLVDDPRADPDTLLKPIFDTIWNAAGWPRCGYFGEDGKWTPPRA